MNVFEEQLGFRPSTFALPKGDDREASDEVFRDMFGFDPPELGGGDNSDVINCDGVTYIRLKGSDIPAFVGEGWVDAGITGNDSVDEYTNQYKKSSWVQIPALDRLDCKEREMGRFSLFAASGLVSPDEFEAEMRQLSRNRAVVRALTSFPNFLWKLAQEQDYPIAPVNFPIRGSVEAARKLFERKGVRYGADVVVSGRSLERNGQAEVKELSKIYPVVVRAQYQREPTLAKWPVFKPGYRSSAQDRTVWI